MTEQELKLQLAEVAGTWVAAIAVVIGGLFGIYQYLEHKSAVRVDRSMAFVERYQGNSMLVAARVKITESQKKHAIQLNQILQDPTIQAKDLAAKYENEILKQIDEDQLNGALEQLFTFYEQIIMCREMALCEADVAEQFFDTNAQDLVHTYYPYICKVRTEWHNPNQFRKITQFYSPNLLC
ncbi:hypothetical protein [uncultured Paraglaciecola sp.]|uniref:DUF4760 domain-containing protein n=1 Tax=uncultured Paraglaciecola sp. TaxID=1765024 RepID=UPI00261D80EC|nr:hypothetical protein [uncultured Paraglaciecola sp.]